MRVKNLHLATTLSTKGGITSVLKVILKLGDQHYHVPSHSDRSRWYSIVYFLSAITKSFALRCENLLVHYGGEVSAFRKYVLSSLYKYNTLIVYQHVALNDNNDDLGFWEKLLLEKADKIIVLGATFIDRLGHLGKKAHVLGNFAEDSFNRIPKKNYVLYAGTFEERKGVKELVIAFKDLNPLDWELILVGAGEYEDALIDLSRDKENIKILSWMERKDLGLLMDETKIFCLPSKAEGLSVAIIEAISHNCLPVVTKVGCHLEYFGEHVIWCDPYSTDSIASALKEAIELVSQREYCGPRPLFEKEFRVERYIERLERVLS